MKKLTKKLVMLAVCGLSMSALNAQHPALGGGTGTSTDPYQIQTPAHLKQLADFVNGGNANGYATAGVYYIVINDLDLSAYAADTGWNPIGNGSSSFQGNFNGNNKKVTNLKINRPTTNYQGLFGYTNGATIENLGIENCNITGREWIGGLVGSNDNYSTISNCYVTGNVSGNFCFVGGLVGTNDNYSHISDCYATVNVSGKNTYVGGLVAQNHNYSQILNCYATGKVIGASGWVGGLVGDNRDNSSISNCYATGNVVGTSNFIGGLAGDNNYRCSISNCYATGDVYGAFIEVGGLVGENSGETIISNCYATGTVSGQDGVGGLVGSNSAWAVIKNCVAANDSVVSITSNSTAVNRICGNTTNTQNNYALSTMVVKNSIGDVTITADSLNGNAGMSKSRTDFQSFAFYATAGNWNTAAWDIDSVSTTAVWNICDGKSLPFLRWQGINCNEESVVYTITATAGANGSITPAGAIDVEEGKDQTFSFSANSGYQIAQVFIDDTNNSAAVAAGSYTFTNVAANHKIEVYFKPTVGIVGAGHALPLPRIYPNPTTGQLRVSGDIGDSGDREIRIFNVVGQVVFTSQLSELSPETTIDISHLANGLYFLKIDNKVIKISKEK